MFTFSHIKCMFGATFILVPDAPPSLVFSAPELFLSATAPATKRMSSLARATAKGSNSTTMDQDDDFDTKLDQTINELKTEGDQAMEDLDSKKEKMKRSVSERGFGGEDDEEENKRGLDKVLEEGDY